MLKEIPICKTRRGTFFILSTFQSKDKLASKWNKPDSNAVIVDVDCTTDDAKDLCSKYGVQGYPTLKYFSPTTSKEGDTYEDGRDLKSMNKFVKRTSKLPCAPATGENCDKKDTAYLEERNEWSDVRCAEGARTTPFACFDYDRTWLSCWREHKKEWVFLSLNECGYTSSRCGFVFSIVSEGVTDQCKTIIFVWCKGILHCTTFTHDHTCICSKEIKEMSADSMKEEKSKMQKDRSEPVWLDWASKVKMTKHAKRCNTSGNDSEKLMLQDASVSPLAKH